MALQCLHVVEALVVAVEGNEFLVRTLLHYAAPVVAALGDGKRTGRSVVNTLNIISTIPTTPFEVHFDGGAINQCATENCSRVRLLLSLSSK